MSKANSAVSYGGSFQNFIDLLSAATRKQGGNLGEAVVLLAKPDNSGAVEEMATIAARVSKQHQAALEAAERVKTISKSAIEVNLASAPKLPFDGATVEHNAGGGWVKVEKKKDGLYVDGKKVVLRLVDGQKTGSVRGHELRTQLGDNVLHPNVMDALYDNPHLIPEDWKQDEQGRTRYIFFWSVIFRDSGGPLYVRCLYWLGGAWLRHSRWLGLDWVVPNPAASLAS